MGRAKACVRRVVAEAQHGRNPTNPGTPSVPEVENAECMALLSGRREGRGGGLGKPDDDYRGRNVVTEPDSSSACLGRGGRGVVVRTPPTPI